MTLADTIVLAGAAGLLTAAVARELRRAPGEREWHGELWGAIPYDLRPPTLRRARRRLWEPAGPLLGPQIFGVGWTINLGRAARLLGVAPAPAGGGLAPAT